MEINECDFCGGEFTYAPDPALEEHDLCVCKECVEFATEQLQEGRLPDLDDEDDFLFDDDSGVFFKKEW